MIIELGEGDCKYAYHSIDQCKMPHFTLGVSEDKIIMYIIKLECCICKYYRVRKKTNYWCSTHKKPICILKCYDLHRKNINL